ncbi:Hypothetical protein IALB_0670 [Ignavibacterium album JCM 16511]|uniref:Thioredoxin-like fold domain-containing protein n=1 Tax=Ignavibacterium album (strain DSM 19864 / JCM 16511 / NBRC 101810 / Mat9-16) TaxID=945713 RepID=I0AHC5_IGNAJ|nr:hypothetical protein [Ignavibacterium album]AFH48382.1 Hypothetical protein IALB_0670 [Ignavibacterium album JCM 16511]
MKNYNKYLLIILFVFLTGINIYNIYRFDNNKINQISHNREREIKYLNLAEKFNDMEFPVVKIYNTVNDSLIMTKIRDGFIILISNSGCSPCQIRELKNLEDFSKGYNKVKDTYAIYVGDYNRLDALRLKKLSAVSFPICYILNNFLSEQFLTKPFPKIFFIVNQKIKSTLIPIPDEEKFSEDFYKKIRN